MTIDHLEAELLRLPRSVRARIAERLLSSLDDDSEIERAWEEEAERRYQRYLVGETGTVQADVGLAEVRTELGFDR